MLGMLLLATLAFTGVYVNGHPVTSDLPGGPIATDLSHRSANRPVQPGRDIIARARLSRTSGDAPLDAVDRDLRPSEATGVSVGNNFLLGYPLTWKELLRLDLYGDTFGRAGWVSHGGTKPAHRFFTERIR